MQQSQYDRTQQNKRSSSLSLSPNPQSNIHSYKETTDCWVTAINVHSKVVHRSTRFIADKSSPQRFDPSHHFGEISLSTETEVV